MLHLTGRKIYITDIIGNVNKTVTLESVRSILSEWFEDLKCLMTFLGACITGKVLIKL